MRSALIATGGILLSIFLTETGHASATKPLPVALSLLRSLAAHATASTEVDQASTAQACISVPIEDPLVKGRARMVRFPNGRSVTVVGHVHGSRQIYEIGALIKNSRLMQMSDAEFDTLLFRIMNENRRVVPIGASKETKQSAVNFYKKKFNIDFSDLLHPENALDLPEVTFERHAIEDYRYLNQLLGQKNSSVQFVGYEGTQRTWASNLPFYLRTRQVLLEQFALRKSRGQIKFSEYYLDPLLLSSSNGNAYTYMVNPQLILKVPMVGTEDEAVTSDPKNADPLEKMFQALNRLKAAGDTYLDSQTKIEKKRLFNEPSLISFFVLALNAYSEVENMSFVSEADLEVQLTQLRAKTPHWLKGEVEELIETFRERVRINFLRDEASARNLVGLNKTGIHFVGLNHFRNTVRNLENLCKQEQNHAQIFY